MEKGEIVYQNDEIATQFNSYFSDITKGLDIKEYCISNKFFHDPLVNAIQMFVALISKLQLLKTIRIFQNNSSSLISIYFATRFVNIPHFKAECVQ